MGNDIWSDVAYGLKLQTLLINFLYWTPDQKAIKLNNKLVYRIFFSEYFLYIKTCILNHLIQYIKWFVLVLTQATKVGD
jgi:hypothetical protein